MKIKKVVNLITISRIFGAFLLLFITPLTALFYIVYTTCIITDIADGFIARKTKTTSNFGAFLDSAADLIFIAVVLIIFIPLLALELWILYLIAVVIVIRLTALAIGFSKYRTLSLLHTYSNKAAGLILACFPIFLGFLGITAAFLIIFAAASISALEELVITIRSKKLNRNITSVFNIE